MIALYIKKIGLELLTALLLCFLIFLSPAYLWYLFTLSYACFLSVAIGLTMHFINQALHALHAGSLLKLFLLFSLIVVIFPTIFLFASINIYPALLLFFTALPSLLSIPFFTVINFVFVLELLLLLTNKYQYSIIELILNPNRVFQSLQQNTSEQTHATHQRVTIESLLLSEAEISSLEWLYKENLRKFKTDFLKKIQDQYQTYVKDNNLNHSQAMEILEKDAEFNQGFVSEEQKRIFSEYLDRSHAINYGDCPISLDNPDNHDGKKFIILEKRYTKAEGNQNFKHYNVPNSTSVFNSHSFSTYLQTCHLPSTTLLREKFESPYPHHEYSTRFVAYPFKKIDGNTVCLELCEIMENFNTETASKSWTKSTQSNSTAQVTNHHHPLPNPSFASNRHEFFSDKINSNSNETMKYPDPAEENKNILRTLS